jgi:hypothetical protein
MIMVICRIFSLHTSVTIRKTDRDRNVLPAGDDRDLAHQVHQPDPRQRRE